jgi:REP element-mobilizing transposase RayT
MLRSFWEKLPTNFPEVELDEFVTMPNHIHGIIMMTVEVAPRGYPNRVLEEPDERGRPHGVAPTALGDIVGWYKTMTTNAYIFGVKNKQWRSFNNRVWQRNYYDHIIRDENYLNRIRQYIIDNPDKWDEDENNPECVDTRDTNRHLQGDTDTK